MTAIIGISSSHITTCVMCKMYIKFIYSSGLFLLQFFRDGVVFISELM